MKVSIQDRTYSSFIISNDDSDMAISNQHDSLISIDPIRLKLFHDDTFSCIDSIFSLINSPTRDAEYLTGVLILDDNKSYGRNKNNKRLMYRCVPSNKRLPDFIVPYDISLKFNKKQTNKFILFRFKEWNIISNHPIGVIIETIGNVDDISSIFTYNLYSKRLNHVMKLFTNETKQICNNYSTIKSNIIDTYTFSIDPKNCIDYDDAFSIKYSNHEYVVSVYIADVVSNIDRFNLWDLFTERVSTIYLPDRRLPMIPQLFSETFCSLKENHTKPTMRIDFYLNQDGSFIDMKDNISFVQTVINKNFIYEEQNLLDDTAYKLLLQLTQLSQPTIDNSHDLVSYWMLKSNHSCARYMNLLKQGIFRVSQPTDFSLNQLCEWNNISSQYQSYGIDFVCDYTHITSPIRRIVDILNQVVIKKNVTGFVTQESQLFLEKWLSKIDIINCSMRSIRKVQLNCELLSYFEKIDNILDKVYEGIIVEKKKKGSSSYSYTIYVSSLKLFSKVSKSVLDLEVKTQIMVSFVIFKTESLMCKKVRLKIV